MFSYVKINYQPGPNLPLGNLGVWSWGSSSRKAGSFVSEFLTQQVREGGSYG